MENEVTVIINEWDPIGLFPGAPLDEYYDEIQQILLFLDTNKTVEELSKRIKDIFENSFNSTVFDKSENECNEIAKKIMKL